MSNRHPAQLVSVVLRLPREQLERLRKLSKATRVIQSEFLREAIADLLVKHGSDVITCSRCHAFGELAEGLCTTCAVLQRAWERSQLICGCGRSHTWAQYLELPAPLNGSQQETEDDEGRPMFLELRNCACGSTMARIPGPFPDGWQP
jgi:hypothetical protein